MKYFVVLLLATLVVCTTSPTAQPQLPVAAVTETDCMVNADGTSPREAARAWLEANSDSVAAWFQNRS